MDFDFYIEPADREFFIQQNIERLKHILTDFLFLLKEKIGDKKFNLKLNTNDGGHRSRVLIEVYTEEDFIELLIIEAELKKRHGQPFLYTEKPDTELTLTRRLFFDILPNKDEYTKILLNKALYGL